MAVQIGTGSGTFGGQGLWLGRKTQAWRKVMAAYHHVDDLYLRADCLYTGISCGPNAW